MDNLEYVAKETPQQRETLDVNRWEDDGGQEAPTNAAPKFSHHQTPYGQTQRLQESVALTNLADDSAKRSGENHE